MMMELRTDKLRYIKQIKQDFYETRQRIPTTKENKEYTETVPLCPEVTTENEH